MLPLGIAWLAGVCLALLLLPPPADPALIAALLALGALCAWRMRASLLGMALLGGAVSLWLADARLQQRMPDAAGRVDRIVTGVVVPVNWAPVNPAPLPGMCRLWAWEAFAHGAETVCYFRWRQAPFAQEQMHAGLLRPDRAPAPALGEAAQVASEIVDAPKVGTAKADVALIFDYASAWAWDVQPQGTGFDYFKLVFETYRGLRKLGLDIDILPPDASDLSAYKLVLAPGLLSLSDPLKAALSRFDGIALIGPRANSKTRELTIPTPLPPNLPGLAATVTHVETFRADMERPLVGGGHIRHWFEHVETDAPVQEGLETGEPVLIGKGRVRYLAGWLDEVALARVLAELCAEAGIQTLKLEGDLRIRRTETHLFVFNYGREAASFEGKTVQPAGVYWDAL